MSFFYFNAPSPPHPTATAFPVNRMRAQFLFGARLLFAALLLGVGVHLTGCDGASKSGAQGQGESEHADDAHEHEELSNTVTLTEAAAANAGIESAEVTTRTFGARTTVPAEVRYVPDNLAHISSITSGIVTAVEVTIGDTVEAGDTLITLRSVEVGQARATLQRARSALDIATQNYTRQKQLRTEQISSERTLLEAKLVYEDARANVSAARNELAAYGASKGSGGDLILSAPIAGTIIERDVIVGESIAPNTRLLTLANTDDVWIVGELYGENVAGITQGMRATFNAASANTPAVDGTIEYLSPVATGPSRAVDIRMSVDNRDKQLRPGQYGTLRVGDGDTTQSPSVAVPIDAIQTIDGTQVVFTTTDALGVFTLVPITAGLTQEGFTQVLSGLDAGATVVTRGAFTLKSERMRHQLDDGHDH